MPDSNLKEKVIDETGVKKPAKRPLPTYLHVLNDGIPELPPEDGIVFDKGPEFYKNLI